MVQHVFGFFCRPRKRKTRVASLSGPLLATCNSSVRSSLVRGSARVNIAISHTTCTDRCTKRRLVQVPTVPLAQSVKFTFTTVRQRRREVQLQEVQLFASGRLPVRIVGASNPGGASPPTQPAANVINGDLRSNGAKWVDLNMANSSRSLLVLQLESPQQLTAYLLHTANDNPARDPTSWTVHCLIGSDWILADAQHAIVPPSARHASYGSFPFLWGPVPAPSSAASRPPPALPATPHRRVRPQRLITQPPPSSSPTLLGQPLPQSHMWPPPPLPRHQPRPPPPSLPPPSPIPRAPHRPPRASHRTLRPPPSPAITPVITYSWVHALHVSSSSVQEPAVQLVAAGLKQSHLPRLPVPPSPQLMSPHTSDPAAPPPLSSVLSVVPLQAQLPPYYDVKQSPGNASVSGGRHRSSSTRNSSITRMPPSQSSSSFIRAQDLVGVSAHGTHRIKDLRTLGAGIGIGALGVLAAALTAACTLGFFTLCRWTRGLSQPTKARHHPSGGSTWAAGSQPEGTVSTNHTSEHDGLLDGPIHSSQSPLSPFTPATHSPTEFKLDEGYRR